MPGEGNLRAEDAAPWYCTCLEFPSEGVWVGSAIERLPGTPSEWMRVGSAIEHLPGTPPTQPSEVPKVWFSRRPRA